MSPVKAVLFDRDGTLVHDVPYNGDPDRVRPVDGAREAVALLREHDIRVGVVTNQSGVARGLITDTDVRHVNRRIDELVGPFDVWAVCPHGPDDGCHCRKPQPGMILWAAGRVCTAPADCVVIGDIGADMEAAERAGAHGILVPNDRTRPEETRAAAHVAPDLLTAVRAVLDGAPKGRVPADERPDEAASDAGADGGGTAAEDAVPGEPGTGRTGRGPGHRRRAGRTAVGEDRDTLAPDARRNVPQQPGGPPVHRAASRPAAQGTDGRADAPDRSATAPDGSAGTGRSGTPDTRDSAHDPRRPAPDAEAAPTRTAVDTRGRPR
ncbi:dehydratase [Streptomyces mutabilis]|nr:dehydratase [Streptomyces mutabilis]